MRFCWLYSDSDLSEVCRILPDDGTRPLHDLRIATISETKIAWVREPAEALRSAVDALPADATLSGGSSNSRS